MLKNSRPELSIIVPVYNVEQYLESCLSSIRRQTYSDFEVIMVDDGSTDGSTEICKKWEQLDKRFHYIRQNNQGLGPARNTGIRFSNSERILFIDSDDWVDDTIVEKLLIKSLETDADIAYGDFCAVYPDGTAKVIPTRSLFQLVNATNKERIDYSFQRSIWGAVYKKNLWIENDLFMPDIIYEDTAIYGLLLYHAKQIVTVSETLYFYRAQRNGSLMQEGKKDYRNMLRALNCFLQNVFRREFDHLYLKNFFRYCIRQLAVDFRNCEKNMDTTELISVKANMEKLLFQYFPFWKDYPVSRFMAFGSFTSCEIYNRLTLFRDSITENYAFTTMESLTSDRLTDNCYEFKSDNTYRIGMVKKDFNKIWKTNLKKSKYIILDLLEERHDIILYNNCYFTKSEAFDEVCQFYDMYQIIPRKSEECRQLWKKSCNIFFEELQREKKQIFVLELYLCEQTGLKGKEDYYQNIDEIREVNNELRYYYDYIRNNFSDIRMISINPEVCFTSVDYSFGCEPWHYNEIALFGLSEQIAESIISKQVKNI